MSAALQVADEMIAGDELVIAGTGFANTTAYTVTIGLPGESPSIKLKGTTSGGGAIDTSTVASILPGHEGIASIVASDGTSTVDTSIKVNRSV